jgi:hypothetical protein
MQMQHLKLKLNTSVLRVLGFELLKLPEDLALAGFTPLMYNMQELVYVPSNIDLVRPSTITKTIRILIADNFPGNGLQLFENQKSPIFRHSIPMWRRPSRAQAATL